MTIELNWKGPYYIHNDPDQDSDFFKKGGVYIWGFKSNGKFIPHYVGVANSTTRLFYRIFEHISHLKSGFCTIWEKESQLIIPYDREKRIETALFWPPISIRQDSDFYKELFPQKYNYNFVLENWTTFEPHIKNMLDNFFYIFSECSDENIYEVEKKIIKDFKIKNLINLRGGISSITKLSHKWNNEERTNNITKDINELMRILY